MAVIQGWLAVGTAGLLATIAPFQREQTDKWIARAGAVGMSTAGLAIALTDDPRQRRRQKAGQLLVTEASYIGEAKRAITSPTSILVSQQQPEALPPAEQPPSEWLPSVQEYCSILLFGGQGSGKSTLASQLIAERCKRGHRVIIADPHADHGQWQGLEVVGDGMRYQEIDKLFTWYNSEVERRYLERRSTSNWDAQPITIICEEMTNWAERCNAAAEFLKSCMSDNRKIRMNAIFVAHDRTLTALGGAKGIAALRDKAMLEIELIPNEKNQSSGKGFLKMPGRLPSEKVAIALPQWEPIYDFLRFNPTLSVAAEESDNSEAEDNDRQPESLPIELSSFVWSVSKVSKFYPDDSPEQLFQSVAAALKTGASVRDVIKTVLRCHRGDSHQTRSYTQHGKTLLRWLIENYDDGAIASLPEVRKFLS